MTSSETQLARPVRRGWRAPIAAKLAAALIGLVVLVLLVNSSINTWLGYDQAKSAALEVQREKARAASDRVGEFLGEIETQLGWTTGAEWRRAPLEQRRYDFIRLLRQVPAITELSYLDGEGKEQLKVSRLEPDALGSGKDFSAEPRFTRAVADKIWFGPVEFRRGSEPYMTIALAHVGKTPGVTVADVNLKLIWDVINAIHVGDKGYAFVVDAQGRLIAHPDLSLVLRGTDFSKLPQVAAALADKDAPETRSGAAEMSTAFDGGAVLTAYATSPRTHWIVFVQLPLAEALATVYKSLWQTLALLGLGLALALVVGGLLARRLVAPIRRLQQGAERLGAGDLSQRLDIRTGDEIETLADRFNQMAGSIQESYDTLEAKVEARTRDLNDALAQQTATAEILKVISASPTSATPVFEAIALTAARLFGCQMSGVWLLTGNVWQPVAGATPERLRLEHERAPPMPFDPSANFPSRAAIERKTLLVTDYTGPDTPPHERFLGEHFGIASTLFLPLMRGETCIGMFLMTSARKDTFDAKAVALAESFRDQARIAVENARLFNETQESLAQQTATADVLKVISRSAFDLDTVFQTLVTTAVDLCKASSGTLCVRDGEAFRYRGMAGPESTPVLQRYLEDHPLVAPTRGTVAGRAILSRRIEQIEDVLAEPDYVVPFASTGSPARALLGVPLLGKNEVLGAIVVARAEPGVFPPRHVEILRTFADQAVIAIENARLFEQVQARTRELAASLDDLRKTQDRLVQTEKLASLGQLTAGIAHEIKNPLNFVNNFSALSRELLEELRDLLAKANLTGGDRDEADELIGILDSNLDKVVHHGKRADSIVKNMLLHSRTGAGEHRPSDINAILEESLNLAYHGARAEKPGFNITMERDLDPKAGIADVFPQEISRALLNLITNGFYAATKRREAEGEGFEPVLAVRTRDLGDRVEIRVRDNGTGIPDEVKAKIFNPFFTTKPAGEGTGLGLSMTHDIVVKQHGGALDVDSSPGAYTEFTLTLPRGGAKQADGQPT